VATKRPSSRRQRRFLVTFASLAALGATCAAVAVAITVPDRDDVPTALDIAKTGGAHNRAADELVHTVDLFEGVNPADMLNTDKPPSSVCVEIWTRSVPGESAADYEICATPDAKGNAWNASITRKRDQGPPLRLGAVKVEQPAPTRLVMRLDPDIIKRPASYRWRTETTSFGKDCSAGAGCPDYAPDRPGTAETKLGKPRS
jgi:hypothetical protein